MQHTRPALPDRPAKRRRQSTCACTECEKVTTISRETLELPSATTYRLLLSFTSCPHTGAAYRTGLRQHPFFGKDREAQRVLEADSIGEESTNDGDLDEAAPPPTAPMTPPFCEQNTPAAEAPVEIEKPVRPRVLVHPVTGGLYPAPSRRLPPFEPHYTDIAAWKACDIHDLIRRLQQRFTMNSREVFSHPRYARARADFTDTKHDIYIDDEIWSEETGCYGASSLNHMLFPEFDKATRSMQSAAGVMRRILLPILGVKDEMTAAARRAVLEKLGVKVVAGKPSNLLDLWAVLSGREEEAFLEAYRKLEEFAHLTDAPARIADVVDTAESRFHLCEALQMVLAEAFCGKWDYARTSGVAKHNLYDLVLQGKPLPPGELPPLGFLRAIAWLSEEYDGLGTEVTLFSHQWKFKSQADWFLIHRETGIIETFDFKNCKDDDLRTAGAPSEWGCHPFTMNVKNTKYNHYVRQLSMYRHSFATDYYPGQVNMRATLLNFQPSKPDEFQVYSFECLDMTSFFNTYTPWIKDDPKHLQYISNPSDLCLSPFPDDDPRAVHGPTKLGTRPVSGEVTALPPDYVWTCGAYTGYSYPLPAFPFKHAWSWFGTPRKGTAEFYEAKMLENPELLHYIPRLVGKTLLCWCRNTTDRCHANVLVKYANLYANGAWTLDTLRNVLMLKNSEGVEVPTRVVDF